MSTNAPSRRRAREADDASRRGGLALAQDSWE